VSDLASLLLLLAGLALVVAGAEIFFAGLMAAAARLRLAPFVLVVALSGLELENLVAGIAANARGLGNVAAGTFLGGTTFLALAVPGLSAVATPLRAAMPAATLAWTVAAPLPLLVLGLDGELGRSDGVLLVAWFSFALAGLAYAGRGLPLALPRPRHRWPLLRMLGGLAVLTGAGEILGEGLRRAVERLGVPESLLGNTALAASVEAEEVARVAVPARRGRGDVALGNIFGTIVHFAALNAGVIALVRPIELDSATRHLHLPVAALSVLLLAAAVAARRGLSRADGALLLAVYAAYVAASILLVV
jgi:cation:H+ antiporter